MTCEIEVAFRMKRWAYWKKESCFNSLLAHGLFANMFSVELSVVLAVVCGLLPFDTGKCWNQAMNIQEGASFNLKNCFSLLWCAMMMTLICFSLECPGFFFLLNRYALTSKCTMDIVWIRRSVWIRLLPKKNNVDKLRRKLFHFFPRRGFPLPFQRIMVLYITLLRQIIFTCKKVI